MKPQGVNRVVIAVKDLDEATALYSRLLGATFHDDSASSESYGMRVAISWDAGIELCAPLPGHDSFTKRFIEQRGEGLMSVVFAVDDLDEARERAENLGIGTIAYFEYEQDRMSEYLRDGYKSYKECILNSIDSCSFGVVVTQMEQR
jgi:methylmalonyl-CoA/ethylmalonyl-CoA epimerase